MKLHDLLLELGRLIRRNFKLRQVILFMLIGAVVANVGLHQIAAEQRLSDKRAGQTAGHNIIPYLQAQMVPCDVFL